MLRLKIYLRFNADGFGMGAEQEDDEEEENSEQENEPWKQSWKTNKKTRDFRNDEDSAAAIVEFI